MQYASLMPKHSASLKTMQVAYADGMEENRRPYRLRRQEWLAYWLSRAGGPKALAIDLDSTDTHLTAMSKGRRNVGDELADKMEQRFELERGTMDASSPPGLEFLYDISSPGLLPSPATPGSNVTPINKISLRDAVMAIGRELAGRDLKSRHKAMLAAAFNDLVQEPGDAEEIAAELEHQLGGGGEAQPMSSRKTASR